MSTSIPSHKSAHLSINQWTQNEVIMFAHQLVNKKFDLIQLQSFEQDFLKGNKITSLLENNRSQVATI